MCDTMNGQLHRPTDHACITRALSDACKVLSTIFYALCSSTEDEVAIKGLNHDLSANASVTSWMASCTTLLIVPACARAW